MTVRKGERRKGKKEWRYRRETKGKKREVEKREEEEKEEKDDRKRLVGK